MDRVGTGSSHMSYSLGALVAVGGFTGYLKTGSAPSLLAGLGIGAMYIYGGHLINNGRSDLGHKVNFGAAALLVGAMLPRYLKTKKTWPAGVMAAAGLLSVIYEGRKALEFM